MLEIVFSDSACGSLKLAQHYGQGEYQSGCIGVIISHDDGTEATPEEIAQAQRQAEEQDRQAWAQAVPLGGNAGDVVGFALNLSVGDISEDVPGPKRQAELTKLYSFVVDHMEEDCNTLLSQAGQALDRIYSASGRGELLRIWYSDDPDELCGFYWLMARLDEARGRGSGGGHQTAPAGASKRRNRLGPAGLGRNRPRRMGPLYGPGQAGLSGHSALLPADLAADSAGERPAAGLSQRQPHQRSGGLL